MLTKIMLLEMIREIIELEKEMKEEPLFNDISTDISNVYNEIYKKISKMYNISYKIIYDLRKITISNLSNIDDEIKVLAIELEEKELNNQKNNLIEEEINKNYIKLSNIFNFIKKIIKIDSNNIYYLCLYQPNKYTENHYNLSELMLSLNEMILNKYSIPLEYLSDLYRNANKNTNEVDLVNEIIKNEACYEWSNISQEKIYNYRDKINKIEKTSKTIDELKNENEFFKKVYEDYEKVKTETIKNNLYNLRSREIQVFNIDLINHLKKYSRICNINMDFNSVKDNKNIKIGNFKDLSFLGLVMIEKMEEPKLDYLNFKNYFKFKNMNFNDILLFIKTYREIGLNGSIYATKETWKGCYHEIASTRKIYIEIENFEVRDGFNLRKEDLENIKQKQYDIYNNIFFKD